MPSPTTTRGRRTRSPRLAGRLFPGSPGRTSNRTFTTDSSRVYPHNLLCSWVFSTPGHCSQPVTVVETSWGGSMPSRSSAPRWSAVGWVAMPRAVCSGVGRWTRLRTRLARSPSKVGKLCVGLARRPVGRGEDAGQGRQDGRGGRRAVLAEDQPAVRRQALHGSPPDLSRQLGGPPRRGVWSAVRQADVGSGRRGIVAGAPTREYVSIRFRRRVWASVVTVGIAGRGKGLRL